MKAIQLFLIFLFTINLSQCDNIRLENNTRLNSSDTVRINEKLESKKLELKEESVEVRALLRRIS